MVMAMLLGGLLTLFAAVLLRSFGCEWISFYNDQKPHQPFDTECHEAIFINRIG